MGSVTSSASTVIGITPAPPSWWLKCPTNPALNQAVTVTSWQMTEVRQVARHVPVGRTRSVVLRGPSVGDEGTLGIRVLSEAKNEALKALLNAGATLLLQNVLGEQWYIEVAAGASRHQVRAAKDSTEVFPVRFFYEWTIPAVEVDVP